MRKSIVSLLLILFAISPAFADGVKSLEDQLAAAKKKAKKSNKMLIVNFTADWCEPCNDMKKKVYDSKAGKKLLKDFERLTIDCSDDESDEVMDFTSKHSLMGFPCAIIYAPDGVELHRILGGTDLKSFKEQLDYAKERLKKYNLILKGLKAKSPSDEILKKALDFYLENLEYDKIDSVIAKIKAKDPKFNNFDKAKIAFSKYITALSKNAKNVDKLLKNLIKIDKKQKYLPEAYQSAFDHYFYTAMNAMIAQNEDLMNSALLAAIESGKKLVKLKNCKDPAAVYSQIAEALLMLGEKDQAIEMVDKAIENAKTPKDKKSYQEQKKLLLNPDLDLEDFDPSKLPEDGGIGPDDLDKIRPGDPDQGEMPGNPNQPLPND